MSWMGGSQSAGFATPSMSSATFAGADDSAIQRASDYSAGLERSGTAAVAGSIGLAPLDLVDTVSSSLGLTERYGINRAVLGSFGAPGLMDFYDQNKGGIELASGVVGIVGSFAVGGELLAGAGAAMKAIRAVPYIGRIAQLDAQYAGALKSLQYVSEANAARGAMGVEQFTAKLTGSALGVPYNMSVSAAKTSVFGAKIAKGLAVNATAEAISGVTLRTNSFVWADDWSENVKNASLGLVIGAGLDTAMARYAVSKIANADRLTRIFAKANDPSGFEAEKIAADRVFLKDAGDLNPEALGYGYGGVTDRVTAGALHASELNRAQPNTIAGKALGQNSENLATPIRKQMFEEVNKATVKGLPGVSDAGFATSTEGAGPGLMQSLSVDPTFLYGTEFIAAAKPGLSASTILNRFSMTTNEAIDKASELLATGTRKATRKVKDPITGRMVDEAYDRKLSAKELASVRDGYKRGVFNNSTVPMVSMEVGEWLPAQMAEIVEGFEHVTPKFTATPVEGASGKIGLWEVPDMGVAVRQDGELIMPGNKPIHRADFHNVLRAYAAGDMAIRDMAASGQQMTIKDGANWFALDMAEKLIQKTGRQDSVKWAGALGRESAMQESLAQKFEILKTKRMAGIASAKMQGISDADPVKAMQTRLALNLPRLSAAQAGLLGDAEHPLEGLLSGFKSADEIRSMSLADIRQGLSQARQIKGFSPEINNLGEELQGNTFGFLRDNDGKAMQPLVGLKRQYAPFEWTKDHLGDRMAAQKIATIGSLTGQESDPFTRGIVNAIVENPDFVQASKVESLMDAQIQSAIPGFINAAPQTAMGGFRDALFSNEHKFRDIPTMLAASRIQDSTNRLVRGMMRQVLEPTIGPVNTLVSGPRNGASKLLLNQYMSARPGWDLVAEKAGGVKALDNQGKQMRGFVLDHKSDINQKRFQAQYGKPLAEGQMLLDASGRTVALDDLAWQAKTQFNRVTDAIREMKNTSNRAQGIGEIAEQEHYVPARSSKGKYIGFVMDAEDNVVPGGTIYASSPEDFAKQKAKLLSDPNSPLMKPGHVFRTRDQVTRFQDLWDKAQSDWVNPGITQRQPGMKSLGTSQGLDINVNAWDEGLEHLRDSFLQHGRDITQILYGDAIKAAKARSTVAALETPTNAGKSATRGRSIYDDYQGLLLGKSALASPDAFFGDTANSIEKRVNQFISEKAPAVTSTYEMLGDWLSRAAPGKVGDAINDKKTFEKLSQELGNFMPFKNVAEMVEKTHGAKRPADLAAITGKLSWFEAASRLRWFESSMAIMNNAGVLTTMPAVIRSFAKMPGEAAEEFAKRVGGLAHVFEGTNGEQVATLDMAKVMYKGMKLGWSKEAHPYYDYMTKRGILGQQITEYQKQFGAIEDQQGWKRFVFGDTSGGAQKSGVPIFGKAIDKVAESGGLDKWAGYMTDHSEDYTRSWSVMSGIVMAEHLGIKGMENQVSFAHEFANKVIANYDPANRPQIFQGALGAPFGLFQTYSINYYQRMFRYIETGNKRALATQMATQGALFGIDTVPGYDTAASAFFHDNKDPDSDGYDSMYKRFGTSAGDLIMNGAVSSIPKLFGAPGTSMYTRGDTNIRVPGFQGIPIYDTAKRVFNGVGAAIGAMGQSGAKGQQLSEIVSNTLTNRPLAGLVEIAGAGGYDTDQSGQVVARSKGFMESMYRIMGVRSMQQQKDIDAFYNNKNADEQQGAQKTQVRLATRAAIRAGNYDSLPQLFADYVKAGGDPAYYSRWVKESYSTATSTRGARQLDSVLGDSDKMDQVGRLLDSQTRISDGPDEDYGASAIAMDEGRQKMDMIPQTPQRLLDPALQQQAQGLVAEQAPQF